MDLPRKNGDVMVFHSFVLVYQRVMTTKFGDVWRHPQLTVKKIRISTIQLITVFNLVSCGMVNDFFRFG